MIAKAKKGDIKVQKAREVHSLPIKTGNTQAQTAEAKKLLNVVYDRGTYYISEPNGDHYVPRDPDLIIDKHCWYIIRFLENKKHKLRVNDVIRFGRVSFKVTELVVTPDEINQAKEILQWAKNNTDFQMQQVNAPDEALPLQEINVGPDRAQNVSRMTLP